MEDPRLSSQLSSHRFCGCLLLCYELLLNSRLLVLPLPNMLGDGTLTP